MSTFDYASAVTIAADTVAELRQCDVYRVLDGMTAERLEPMADYLTSNRPDLAQEVENCVYDIRKERA